jgi:hypothetical protein
MRQPPAAMIFLLLLLCISLRGALSSSAAGPDGVVGFGIMIDAGSTATRIHVYRWITAKDALPNFTHDHFLEVSPGLSSFKQKPLLAGKSIIPLLDLARKEIPAELQAETSVYVKATAGLRLLGEETQMQILDSVFLTIESFPFRCKREWVSVIDGQEEAVGAWVTVNYLIDKLSAPAATVGVLDLGGASTQLSCAPASASAVGARDTDKLVSVPIGSSSVKVYVTSWLRYGLMEFRKRIDEAVHSIGMSQGHTSGATHHPCFPKQHDLVVDVNGENVQFHGTGNFDACSDAVASVMKALDYAAPPCSGRFLAISYYLDVLQSVGLGPVVGVADITAKASSMCGLTLSELSPLLEGAKKGFDARVCGDLIYIAALLSGPVGLRASAVASARPQQSSPQYDTLAGDFMPGYVSSCPPPPLCFPSLSRTPFPTSHVAPLIHFCCSYIRLAKKISGKELSWTLGDTCELLIYCPPPPLRLTCAAGAMLAAIPAREPQISKQAPLPPVMDVPVDAPPQLSFIQGVWASISVSQSGRPPPRPFFPLILFACPTDVVVGLPPRGSQRGSNSSTELLFVH